MDQEKIGKFIAKCRKEKNMTQQELANKLMVTDRAIGNWENGRRLPDYSVVKDLCLELGISINELFAGERIIEKDIKKQSEKNIINLLKFSNLKIKKDKIIKYVYIFVIILICTVSFIFFKNESNSLLYCKEYVIGKGNIKGEVDIYFFTSKSKDFDIGANKYGYAVFKDPDKAFERLKKDYQKGIDLIQREFNLTPLTKTNYDWYETYGWQVTGGTEEEQLQARFVTKFFDIYENSFKKNTILR